MPRGQPQPSQHHPWMFEHLFEFYRTNFEAAQDRMQVLEELLEEATTMRDLYRDEMITRAEQLHTANLRVEELENRMRAVQQRNHQLIQQNNDLDLQHQALWQAAHYLTGGMDIDSYYRAELNALVEEEIATIPSPTRENHRQARRNLLEELEEEARAEEHREMMRELFGDDDL